MHPRHRSPVALLLSTSLLLTQSGCYDWVAIQPTELPKLRPGVSQQIGQTTNTRGTTSVYEISVQTVTAEDGTSVQIKGNYDLRLTTTGNVVTVYNHPVVVDSVPPSAYIVQGSNKPRQSVDVADIKKAEFSRVNVWKTAPIFIAAGLALGLLIVAVKD